MRGDPGLDGDDGSAGDIVRISPMDIPIFGGYALLRNMYHPCIYPFYVYI